MMTRDRKGLADLDAKPRRRGKSTSRDVVRHSAAKYGYELSDLTDETVDYFWRTSDKQSVQVLYARGGGRVISVWVGGHLANIGKGRTQAIKALAGDKVISDLTPRAESSPVTTVSYDGCDLGIVRPKPNAVIGTSYLAVTYTKSDSTEMVIGEFASEDLAAREIAQWHEVDFEDDE